MRNASVSDEPDDMIGELRIGVAEQRVAPSDQLMSIGVRGAEELAQHSHRELLGDFLHEVELGLGERHIEDLTRQLADGVLERLHRLSGEPSVHQPPQAGVIGRVLLHERSTGRGLLVVHLLEANALDRGEGLIVPADGEGIAVAENRPESRAVGLVGPVHRVLTAEAGERGVGHAGGVGVVAGEVGVVRAELGQIVIHEGGSGRRRRHAWVHDGLLRSFDSE